MVFVEGTTEKAFVTLTNKTKLLIICGPNFDAGQSYVFQTRVKALCGFGAKSFALGLYPSHGKFCFGS